MRERLTYANVVSTLALFGVIAGGTAVALPGKNSVKANDIKKNAVKAAAIAGGAVGTSEIADGAITGADVADGGLGYADLGSNSVIARARSTASVNTGDGGSANPVAVPLANNTWTQAANEIDVGFAQVTFTQPPSCAMGYLRVEYLLDGEVADVETYDESAPGTYTQPGMTARPFLFEPGQPTNRTLTVRAFDTCGNAGENFTVQSVAANVIGTR